MEQSPSTPETTPGEYQGLMPIMPYELFCERQKLLEEFVAKTLRPGTDFGPKGEALKPGAEKLAIYFGLAAHFSVIESVTDWTGENSGGEPLFSYSYRCSLKRNGVIVAEADGCCSSREIKYHYRQAERVCPACGVAAIRKGSDKYGGGWYCDKKNSGGCGAKYKDGDPAVESQEVGRVLNPETADMANTYVRMAQKRAFVAAVLIAVGASALFPEIEETPDTRETVDHDTGEMKGGAKRAAKPPATTPSTPPVQAADVGSATNASIDRKALFANAVRLAGETGMGDAVIFREWLHEKHGINMLKEASDELMVTIVLALQKMAAGPPPDEVQLPAGDGSTVGGTNTEGVVDNGPVFDPFED